MVVCLAIGLKTALDTPLGRNTFEIELTNSQTGLTELFYDLGEGFTPEQRISESLLEQDQKTMLVFDLPQEPIVHLRWDPVYHEDGVETVIHSAKMSYYGGESVKAIEFESVVPQNHIKTFEIRENSIHFTVENGFSDPYLVFTKIPSAPEEPSRTWIIVKGLVFSLFAAVLFSAIYRLIIWYFDS